MYTIYGKDGCEYCTKSVELLKSKGLSYEYRNIGVDVSKSELVTVVINATGKTPTTVPQIFNGGTYVGGFDQLNSNLS